VRDNEQYAVDGGILTTGDSYRAIEQHESALVGLTYDPLLRGLHADPRFAAVCEKMGLPIPTGVPVSTKPPPSAPAAERTP
jgi:hypothetical protein